MAFKTIFVTLNDISRNAEMLAAAADLARDFDAHVIGHYVIPAVEVYGADGLVASIPVIFEGRRDHFRDAEASVKAMFSATIINQGLRGHFEVVNSGTPDIASVVIDHAQRADIVIASQADPSTNTMLESDFIERVLLSTGRPILVVPRRGKTDLKTEVAILGWNNSREAARSAFDSVPLLRRAASVRVAWVDPEAEFRSPGALPGAEIAESLSRHGVKASVEPLSTGGTRGAGEALIQKARDEGAGLLVMGAYGHSRLREFILGGATRSVLDAMECPILFSH